MSNLRINSINTAREKFVMIGKIGKDYTKKCIIETKEHCKKIIRRAPNTNKADYMFQPEYIEGNTVLRKNILTPKGDVSYTIFSDYKTGELKGIEEGSFLLAEKDGNIIETFSDDFYKIVTDKNGRVKELSQWTSKDGITTFREDSKGNIVKINSKL